ncbi:Rho termination factor N-terminal domain-containing protein [Pseudonocardia nigra]|nr:Rho termination factor N-terminal domain-containing protein [Pseudonocardia nigra]
MRIGELREHARRLGIDGADQLHKPELLAKVKDRHYTRAHSGRHRPDTTR